MSKRTGHLHSSNLLRCWSLGGVAIVCLGLTLGCRGNLGSAFSVATGRVDVDSFQGLAADRRQPNDSSTEVNQASFSPADSPSANRLFAAVDPETGNPNPPPTEDEALAAILPELQQLAATNPAAQRELLAQLQTAEPVHWPQLVHRFKSDLAVHAQLSQPQTTSPPTDDGELQQPDFHTATRPSPQVIVALPPPPPASRFPVQQAAYTQPEPAAPGHFVPPPAQTSAKLIPPNNEAVDPATVQTLIQLLSAQVSPTEGLKSVPQATPTPLSSAAAAGEWRDALHQAIARLDATTATHPQSASESYQHARLRLMQLAAGDLDGAATAIPGLSSTEQSYWSSQLFAIAKLMDDGAQPEMKRRASAANLHLTAAAAKLDQLSSLVVRGLTFCERVHGYGAYDPVPSALFQPGQVLTLYTEVDHYRSEPTDEGRHSSLASSYRIFSLGEGPQVDGSQVDAGDFPLVEDYCLSPRRDFHIQYTLPLPERLAPGEYRLELLIEDQLGHKRGHASTDFTIVANR